MNNGSSSSPVALVCHPQDGDRGGPGEGAEARRNVTEERPTCAWMISFISTLFDELSILVTINNMILYIAGYHPNPYLRQLQSILKAQGPHNIEQDWGWDWGWVPISI